jgi:type I restriction enzyme S subunit
VTLPKGWALVSIGDVVEARVDQGEPGNSPVSYIDIGSIDRDSKRVTATKQVNCATAPTRARQWVCRGDVLVSMTRPNLNAVAIITPELDGAVASTGFDVLRAIGILPEWLFYRVRTHAFVQDVCDDVQGVVYPAIRPDDVRRHMLPIAPFDEQRRIVDAVESYLSRLDAGFASVGRAQAKLKSYRASVLKAAVEGRLVPTEGELARGEKREYEPADVLLKRILDERRRQWEETQLAKLKGRGKWPADASWKVKYREPMAPNTSHLPELPNGWCWATADQLFTKPPCHCNVRADHSASPKAFRYEALCSALTFGSAGARQKCGPIPTVSWALKSLIALGLFSR